MDCEKAHPVARSVIVVNGDRLDQISASETGAESVGAKALGLLRLPEPWVPKFFVVSGSVLASQDAVMQAAAACDMPSICRVYVRSNGSNEGIAERGSLDSQPCDLKDVVQTIETMKVAPAMKEGQQNQIIHFIVQIHIQEKEKGHLSNERRLSRHPRDWHAEIQGKGLEPVGVRRWRDASSAADSPLRCDNKASISRALRAAASWAQSCRAHMEWIWDGANVWMVQLDFLRPEVDGVDPRSLVSKAKRPDFNNEDLELFALANEDHFAKYPKLKNAKLYTELGYSMPHFYVMDNEQAIQSILNESAVPESLRADLAKLCKFPFVLRTDATGLKLEERQMLPRSDELRTPEAAVEWLTGRFRELMLTMPNATGITLIGHHFIPATASAWAQARPDERRVRIEALWGIPEGTYYFAHDVYDVDTGVVDVQKGSEGTCQLIAPRERYKSKFIAPNRDGEWIVQKTNESSDWAGSIWRKKWLYEIAWTTRRIAAKAEKPVVVMWFVDVPSQQSKHRVLPWYHEPWMPVTGGYRAARRKKVSNAQLREISNRATWDALVADVASGARVERIFINPDDSEIVRDREFVKVLASHAKEHGYIIELSGGLLSHAFYMLSKEGCNVECVDLFGVNEEKVEYNKIVRDLIPQGIESRGEQVEIVKVSSDALLEALKKKLIEEAFEAIDATSADSIVEELADLEEVVDAILGALGVDHREMTKARENKRRKRGGFNDGTMLVRTSLAAPLLAEMLSESPQQIREIRNPKDLPLAEQDFHVDHRTDISGNPERQLTMTLPAHGLDYLAGNHRFDLVTPQGNRHEMYFSAKVERHGATLKLRVSLTNAAIQLQLPLSDGSDN